MERELLVTGTMLHTTRSVLFAAAALLLSTSLAAQRTWIVDRNGGPGFDFRDLAAGVAAAADGDTIIVRAGDYHPGHLDIDKGLTLIGQGSVLVSPSAIGGANGFAGIFVHDLAADQPFAIRDIDLEGVFASPEIQFENCAGVVTVQGARARLGPRGEALSMAFKFVDCDQVLFSNCFVRGAGSMQIVRSRGSITACAIEGNNGGPVLIQDSHITLASCAISSGFGGFAFGAPIHLNGGELRITRATVRANSSLVSPDLEAITVTGGTLILDPTASLSPVGNAPPIAGTANVIHRELVSLSADASATDVSLDLHTTTNGLFVTMLSFPTTAVPTPWGDDLFVHADGHLLIDSGAMAGRARRTQIPAIGLPVGLKAVVQTVTFDGQFKLSNAAALVFP